MKKYASRGRAAFDAEELVQTWILHHLLLMGEAAAQLSDAFCDEHPDVPWAYIDASLPCYEESSPSKADDRQA